MSYIVYRQDKRNRQSEKIRIGYWVKKEKKKVEKNREINNIFFLATTLEFALTVNLSKLEFGCNWDKLSSSDSFLIDK